MKKFVSIVATGIEAMPPSVGSVAGKSVGSVGGNRLASLPVGFIGGIRKNHPGTDAPG